jgi:hypothetical protein
MDKIVINFARDYHLAVHHAVYIALLIAGFVCAAGCIRFGIAVYRRAKGIYPPAASQMEEH